MMKISRVVVFDLDDTLYKEVSFLQSAYNAIASEVESSYGLQGIYNQMLYWWQQGENVFENLISFFHLPLTIDELKEKYRLHVPKIVLEEEVRQTLGKLEAKAVLGLVTDGRSVTQRNKIEALGLSEWMQASDMLISGESGFEKPSEVPFRFFMQTYPSCTYYYIGDNPQKDFIAPNHLGWTTVCLLDDGRHIHKQNFSLSKDMLPKYTISHIAEIDNIII